MRKSITGIGCWLLCLTLTLSHANALANADSQFRLDKLKQDIVNLKQRLFNKNVQADDLANELQQQELDLTVVQGEIIKLNDSFLALNTELASLNNQKSKLLEKKQQQQAQLAKHIQAAHRQGRSDPLRLLLNQEDPQKIARILTYYRYFSEARSQKILSFNKTIETITVISQGINKKQQLIATNRQRQQQQLKALKNKQSSRKLLLANINNTLDTDNAQLLNLKKEQKDLEQLLVELNKAIHSLGERISTPFLKNKGKMPWPVAGDLSHNFGAKRAQNMTWSGWLLSTPEGKIIKSIHKGRVIFSDYLRGQGLMIIIDHGDNYISLYAHNQVLSKAVGDWVQAGDKVALAGATGGLENSALYFEIRHNGKAINPKSWLTAKP